MIIKFNKKFVKMYDKAPAKVHQSFDQRLKLFTKDRYHPFLNNHQLTGKYLGYQSINVTGNWRAIFKQDIEKDAVTFYLLGTHPQLYG